MKLQDYISYYIGCKCQTPDGIGELVGLPWRIKQQDRATIHFGSIVNTENSIDRSAGKLRNHGDYLLQAQRMEPIGSEGITGDGFDLPGGVKPILRRLEDMTEEEKTHIGKLAGWYEGKKIINEHHLEVAHDAMKEMAYDCLITANDNEGDRLGPAAYFSFMPYLLRQGFDLFGLIDAGLAIDIKTLTP